MIDTPISSEEFDILMITEGTYPYERGGVASWIYDVIKSIPEYNFGLLFLGAYPEMYTEYAYDIPENLVHLEQVYLFEDMESREGLTKVNKNAPEILKILHENFKASLNQKSGLKNNLVDLNALMSKKDGFDFVQFMRSFQSWEFIRSEYKKFSGEPSFLNYFWNIRNMHFPLWHLREAIDNLPKFKLVHPIATGYSGLLSLMIKQKTKTPIILTEHGLYGKERGIELLQSPLMNHSNYLLSENKSLSYHHKLWVNFFTALSRVTYHESEKIISLFHGAREQQIAYGAEEEKAVVVANGINIDTFSHLRRTYKKVPQRICFVGRFVRIKDIKTFIRSVYLMQKEDNDIIALIKMVGKPDEDYLKECTDFISFLGIEKNIEFVEEGGMIEILEQSSLLILSSISEGMPLVLLETLAAGVPAITTDVGACKEIIEGITKEDKALGKAGSVVSIANAQSLARETLKLLNNVELWHKAQKAGIKRVEQFYNHDLMIDKYKALYKESL